MKVAYIDSQNIKLGVMELGWEIDRERFYIYIKNRYNINEIKYFVGYLSTNKEFYQELRAIGYTVIFKKTHEYNGKVKGNVDTLITKIGIKDSDNGILGKAYLFSGDGDFEVLIEYRKEVGHFAKVFLPNHNKVSKLLTDITDNTTLNYLIDIEKHIKKTTQ